MQNVKKSEVKTYWRKKCFWPFYSFFLFCWLIEWFKKIWGSLWTQNETLHVPGVWSIFRNLGYIKIFSQHAWRLLGSLKKVPSVILSSNYDLANLICQTVVSLNFTKKKFLMILLFSMTSVSWTNGLPVSPQIMKLVMINYGGIWGHIVICLHQFH